MPNQEVPGTEESDKEILVEYNDGIAIVTINRPSRRNGMTVSMCQEMLAALNSIAVSAARVVVLRGAASDFCVGADMDSAPLPRNGHSLLEVMGASFHSATALHAMPQVTIAAIDGGCAGAGLGWACACDFRFASTRAKFSTAFLRVAASGDMGLAWSLARIVGGARAREMLFFPEKFGAEQALTWGLVTRVFEPESLFDASLQAARELAASQPFALRMMKANMLSAETLPFDAFVDIETARQLSIADAGAISQGFASFRAHKPTSKSD